MGADGYKRQMNDLFIKYIVVSYKEKCDVQQGIEPTTSRISVSLQRHKLSKNWIEKINHRKDQYPDMFVQVSHEAAKVGVN